MNEEEILNLQIKLKNTEIKLAKAEVSYLTQKRKRNYEKVKKEKYKNRIANLLEYLTKCEIKDAEGNTIKIYDLYNKVIKKMEKCIDNE